MDLFYYLCGLTTCIMSVSFSLVITCWKKADLLDLVYVMFFLCFITFPYSVLGQVWYLIISTPDLCILPYFSWSPSGCNVCVSRALQSS